MHWNRDLQEFVVLMSRSVGGNYESGGIYMTHTTTLNRPYSWALPKLIIKDYQGWYPQAGSAKGMVVTPTLGRVFSCETTGRQVHDQPHTAHFQRFKIGS